MTRKCIGSAWEVSRKQDSKKYADTTSFVVTAVMTNLVVIPLSYCTGVQSSLDPEFFLHDPNLDLNFFPDDNSYFCLQTPK